MRSLNFCSNEEVCIFRDCHKKIKECLNGKEGVNLLDYGCGTGEKTIEYALGINSYSGIDISDV